MYLLFVSSYCKYSKHFVDMVREIGDEKFFNIISVDKKNGKRPSVVFNHGITEVPTVIVNGKKYAGKDAFKWLRSQIKNLNHQVSSQDTRMNKNVISGFGYHSDNFSFNQVEDFDGNSSYASLGYQSNIETPDEGTEVEKSGIVMTDDNLTDSRNLPKLEKRKDRTSVAQSALDNLVQEREHFDSALRKRNGY
jgi:glutaredoxin